MSCPNFHKTNARNYYVISDYIVDEDGIERMKDSYDYDFDMDCTCNYAHDEKNYTIVDRTDRDNYNDSMDSIPILEKSSWENFSKSEYGFCSIKIKQEIFVLCGHYSGANYDWDIEVHFNHGETLRLSQYDDIEDLVEDAYEAWECNLSVFYTEGWEKGFIKMQKKNFKKWLSELINKASDEADDFCKSVCDEEYVCTGIFSNGEAVYTKVSAA